jgi:tripartite-type tricarboxylate transporter receptor subunit TctC
MTSLHASRTAITATLAVLAALQSAPVAAQEWPAKPVRIVVGFAPGGGTDIVARIVAPPLSQVLGQPVVIENKPGAGGVTGADAVAKAPKDGYTAYFMNSGFTVSATMFKSLPYDSVKDFQPIALVASASLVALVGKGFQGNTMKALVDKAKAEPGKLKFASVGVGSIQHFAGELFRQLTGTDIKHVPYAGTPQAVAALRNDEVQVLFELVQAVRGSIEAGDVKPLGITAAVRWPTLPEVSTLQEQGIAGYDVTSWYGLAFPAGTPRAIVEKMNKALYTAVSREAVRKEIEQAGAVASLSSPEDLGAYVSGEISKWRAVRDKAGILPQS